MSGKDRERGADTLGGSSVPSAPRHAPVAAKSRRILVIATVEVPTDNVPTEEQLNADVRQALTGAAAATGNR